jgi:hypothetical protein
LTKQWRASIKSFHLEQHLRTPSLLKMSMSVPVWQT